MKKVIIGVGLGLVAASQAQAWTGGIEDMRAMQANERGPVVRIKSVRVDGWQGGKYHTSPASYQCTADGRCHDGWRVLKGSQGVHGHGHGQRAQGRHARGCSNTCGYGTQRGRAHGGQSQAAAQAKRAQRQAYYAAQAQRKAQLLAQKRRAVQQAAQQQQLALQQQRLLAAQRQATALQQQRLQQQRAQQQRVQQQKIQQQRRQAAAAQHHLVQQVAAVAPAPCRSSCGGWQRSASVHVQKMRAPQAHAYCAS